jgi:hypothetical protein
MMSWCDSREFVLEWSSEEVVVPYISPVDGRPHRYFVDFWVKMVDTNGKITETLYEIKPKSQSLKPTAPKNKNRKAQQRYLNEIETYVVNQAKWKAAKAFAVSRGLDFFVLTEEELNIKKY